MSEQASGKADKKGDGEGPAAPDSKVRSTTPENKEGVLNPSAPEDANVTPGSATTKIS